MPLSTFALVSLQELKDHLGSGGAAKDSVLETVINRVSDEIEDYLERQIVTRGTLTEFHTFTAAGVAFYSADLRTLEYPIASVTTVHEDSGVPRTYGAGALLVADTDYQVVKPSGVIRRISGLGQPMNWATGLRAVKLTYAAGALRPSSGTSKSAGRSGCRARRTRWATTPGSPRRP
jgi:hypothetical protein